MEMAANGGSVRLLSHENGFGEHFQFHPVYRNSPQLDLGLV